MGQQETKQQEAQPLEIKKIDLQSALSGECDLTIAQQFRDFNFVVLQPDEKTREIVKEYYAAGRTFFELPTQQKFNLVRVQDDLTNAVRKKNEGYLLVEGVKEYLKLRIVDDISVFPTTPEHFHQSFEAVFHLFESILHVCFRSVATHVNQSTGKPFLSPEIFESVMKHAQRKSSVSLIHYWAKTNEEIHKEKAQANSNEGGIYRGSLAVDAINDTDFVDTHFPSDTHTDTGLLTLIPCAQVPGLQIFDEQRKVWLEVEKMFEPGDIFVIVGRKTTFFAQEQPPYFSPTIHRVALPANSERDSLLYFFDVPQ